MLTNHRRPINTYTLRYTTMLMSPDLFLDCIMYLINENTETSRRLVQELIVIFESDTKNHVTVDNDVTKFYIRIIKSIIDTRVTRQNVDELNLILLKFQSDPFLSKRKEIYQPLHGLLTSGVVATQEMINQYQSRINTALTVNRCNKSLRHAYATLARIGDMTDPLNQAEEIQKLSSIGKELDLATTQTYVVRERSSSLVERVDLSDKDSMKAALVRNNERSVTGVLKLGLQGLNRMFGRRGGLVRGESAVFYALPHNYKSSLILSAAAWVALYNTPVLNKENGYTKHLILLISLENEAYQNFVWMYRHFYETQNMMSSEHLTDDQVADWCYSAFNERGYRLIIERHIPSKFTFRNFVEMVEGYKRSGYEVVLAAIDYLNLMSKDELGTEAGLRHDLSVRALFSASCNYTKTEGITFISAHPLHRKAKEIASNGMTNVVKRLDTSHLADSFDVAREVDLEIFIHIERNLDGTAYLTFQRGKHRYVDDTPLIHQYCAYRFHPKFGIRDDLLIGPEFVTDIYSDPRSSEGTRGNPNQAVETDVYETTVF